MENVERCVVARSSVEIKPMHMKNDIRTTIDIRSTSESVATLKKHFIRLWAKWVGRYQFSFRKKHTPTNLHTHPYVINYLQVLGVIGLFNTKDHGTITQVLLAPFSCLETNTVTILSQICVTLSVCLLGTLTPSISGL